jgi:hypothetical protein
LQTQFAALSAQGQSVLDDIATTRETTLLRFDQGLSALNSRQQRAARINAPDIVCRFVISDMLDIDQTLTSAAVRADAGAVTLRERQKPSNAAIKNLTFSSNTGAVEQFNNMYRVHVVDGSTPVGTFQIELFNPSELTLVVFDIVTMPSDPGIRVFASSDGVTQVEASATSRSRYRVNAWFPAMPVKYLQIQIARPESKVKRAAADIRMVGPILKDRGIGSAQEVVLKRMVTGANTSSGDARQNFTTRVGPPNKINPIAIRASAFLPRPTHPDAISAVTHGGESAVQWAAF